MLASISLETVSFFGTYEIHRIQRHQISGYGYSQHSRRTVTQGSKDADIIDGVVYIY